MTRIAYLIAAALTVASVSASAADRGPSAARGKQLFLRDGCWECHGTVGQGSTSGLKLAPDPIALETMTSFVHNTTTMPAYSPKVLPDADVADIHAYLASIPKNPSPDNIAILKNLKDTK